MADVLLLGNGLSRLLHEDDLVASWTGELWGANYIYRTHGRKLTRLTGHANVLVEAAEYREQHGLTYKIMGRLGKEESPEAPLLAPGQFHKDSGTILVSQAHEEGFDTIYACGFDIGGPDILSPDLHLQRKAVWVKRWRALLEHYGSDRVRFVGFDHMPYLLGGQSDHAYERRYLRGLPHIPDPEYIALHRLIYGPHIGWRREKVVKVRWIKGSRPGWETEYSESIAQKMRDRGDVEILGVVRDVEQVPAPDEADEIAADMKVTQRMSVATLREVARLRGIEDPDELKKAELLALLRE